MSKRDVSSLTDLTVAAKRHDASPPEEHAAEEPIHQQIHRMFLLRVKLMHFVNSLHNYIMTRVGVFSFFFFFFLVRVDLYPTPRLLDIKHGHVLPLSIYVQILHSTGLEFQHQVQEAKDLDQLIKIHYRYLSTIHDRCLLREKVRRTLAYSINAAPYENRVGVSDHLTDSGISCANIYSLNHAVDYFPVRARPPGVLFLPESDVSFVKLTRVMKVSLCFQVSFVKEAIMKVLNLVLIFSDRWQAGFGAWK